MTWTLGPESDARRRTLDRRTVRASNGTGTYYPPKFRSLSKSEPARSPVVRLDDWYQRWEHLIAPVLFAVGFAMLGYVVAVIGWTVGTWLN